MSDFNDGPGGMHTYPTPLERVLQGRLQEVIKELEHWRSVHEEDYRMYETERSRAAKLEQENQKLRAQFAALWVQMKRLVGDMDNAITRTTLSAEEMNVAKLGSPGFERLGDLRDGRP
jgi:hypothetical protein